MKKLLPLAFVLCIFTAKAQNYADTTYLRQRMEKMDRILNILREFRIQIYIQPEWQWAQTEGASSVEGGNFPADASNRLLIRRGRFKLGWQHEVVNKHGDTIKVGEFAFQFDATEKGFNALKDMYGRIIDPWTGWFSIQGGITVRPFGWESPAPPATYESPEFSRMNQTIMPNECELGETFIIESPRTFKPVYLRFDAGVVNGEGVGNTGTGQASISTGAYQSAKDFVGRIMVGKKVDIGTNAKFTFMASGSYYYGNVLQTTNNVWEVVQNQTTGLDTFKNITAGTADTAGKGHTEYHREYYGAHLQVNFDYKIGGSFSGTSALRGEFIAGQQPGQASSSTVPLGAGTSAPVADLYIRKFDGYMITFTQSFHYMAGKQPMHSDLTFKMDFYDPNTQVKGDAINTGAKFSSTDIAYTTLSGGYTWTPVPYFKLMLWYDHVMNEATGITNFTGTNPKIDVFTLRTQFMIDSWWFDKKSTHNDNYINRSY